MTYKKSSRLRHRNVLAATGPLVWISLRRSSTEIVTLFADLAKARYGLNPLVRVLANGFGGSHWGCTLPSDDDDHHHHHGENWRQQRTKSHTRARAHTHTHTGTE